MRTGTHVVKMSLVEPISFSSNGEYLAHSGTDGTLRIFQVITGQKVQEYTPSSHLSASCSCLSWSPGSEEVTALANTYVHVHVHGLSILYT